MCYKYNIYVVQDGKLYEKLVRDRMKTFSIDSVGTPRIETFNRLVYGLASKFGCDIRY